MTAISPPNDITDSIHAAIPLFDCFLSVNLYPLLCRVCILFILIFMIFIHLPVRHMFLSLISMPDSNIIHLPAFFYYTKTYLFMQPVRQSHRDFAFNFVTVHSYLVPVTDFADASHSKSAKSATTTVSYGIFSSENAYL